MVLFGVSLVLATAGCGDEDDGDLEAWCELMLDLDQRSESPTDEQYQQLVDLAPDEIASDVEAAVTILEDDGDAALGTPKLETRLDAVFEFRDSEC